MVTGIISIVLSAIVFITAITAGISAIFQQQVQYLMYICAAILFVGGFILLKLNALNSSITELCHKMGCGDTFLSQINDNSLRKEVADGRYDKSIAELIGKFNSLPDGEEKLSIAYELVELGEISYKKYLQKLYK